MQLGLLFQGIRHQCSIRLMWHVKSVLVKSKFVSVAFSVTSKYLRMSLRFWDGGCLLELDMLLYDRETPDKNR